MRQRTGRIKLLLTMLLALNLLALFSRSGAQEGSITEEGATPEAGSAQEGSITEGGAPETLLEPTIASVEMLSPGEGMTIPTPTLLPTKEIDVQSQVVIGRDIAFMAGSHGKILDSNGADITPSAVSASLYPVWSLNGLQTAYAQVPGNICIFDWVTNGVVQCDPASAAVVAPRVSDTYWDPVWSPNGQRIAFFLSQNNRFDIFVSNRDGSGLENLTASLSIGTVANISPAWSPDGQFIVFAGNQNGETNDYDIFVVNVTTKAVTTVVSDSHINFLPFWRRSGGNKLGFLSDNPICTLGICIIDDYTVASPVIRAFDPATDGTDEWAAVWSPDGAGVRAAYMKYQTNNWDIFVNGTNITHSTGINEIIPKWRPTMEEALRLFNVYIAIDSTDTALRQHLTREVLIGVEDTAKALNNQFVNIPGSYLEAFIEVMNAGAPPNFPISFVFFQRSGACLASNGATPAGTAASLLNGLQATLGSTTHQSVIECNINFGTSFTRYTAVHELGHTFVGVTGGLASGTGSFFGLIQNPILGTIAGIIGVDGNIVMGTFGETDPATGQTVSGWVRGGRGWGEVTP